MQTTSFENHTPVMSMQLKTENQYCPVGVTARNGRAILAAVQEWESSLLGVRKTTSRSWWPNSGRNQNGRGISVNKQNLYRYLKNEAVQRSTPVMSSSFRRRSLMQCR
ncbi:Uncharacterised protein [Klebsiella michiganensis]|nr:Uncharacterised protein [Klebsiella michiganensis]